MSSSPRMLFLVGPSAVPVCSVVPPETGLSLLDGGREDVQLVVQIHPVLDPCSLPTEVGQQVGQPLHLSGPLSVLFGDWS